ncbi:MAG: NUDIX domain-containing protein [Candidatus Roizmanbacteria bacterium]
MIDSNLKNDYTATGYVINRAKSKMLLIFHKKLQKWVPPGGHLDVGELPHLGAIREVKEETGVVATIIPNGYEFGINSQDESQLPTPYCILHEHIPANKNVAEHMHIDFIYLLEAEENNLVFQLQEVSDAKWMTLEEINSSLTFDGLKILAKNILL